MDYELMILALLAYVILYTIFICGPMFLYARLKKIPTKLKKYKNTIITNNKSLNIKEIADKLLNYNVAIKVRLDDEKLFFQDKVSLFSWGKMYIVTVEKNKLTLHYRNVLGIYNINKSDLREMKDIIEIIVG